MTKSNSLQHTNKWLSFIGTSKIIYVTVTLKLMENPQEY